MKITYKILTISHPELYITHYWIQKTKHRGLWASLEVLGRYRSKESGLMPFTHLIEAEVRIKELQKNDRKIKTKTRGVGAFIQRFAKRLSRKRNR